LTVEEYQKIAMNMPHFKQLMISGGEPLLRDDLRHIVQAFLDYNHIEYLTVPTNATMPERIYDFSEKVLYLDAVRIAVKGRRLKHFNIALPVDAVGRKHDEIRGFPGNFEKLVETLRLLKPLRSQYPLFKVSTVTTISSFNEQRLPELINLLSMWKDANLIDNAAVNLCRGQPRDPAASKVYIPNYAAFAKMLDAGKFSYGFRGASLWKRKTRYQHELIEQIYREQKRVLPCYAGEMGLVIDELGNVKPCELLDWNLGNLRELDYDFRKIKLTDAQRDELRNRCYCTHECWLALSCLRHFNRWVL